MTSKDPRLRGDDRQVAMKLGILETGRPPELLMAKHGSYADMFKAGLERIRAGFQFTVYPVLENQFPKSIHEQDGWLITGSKCSAYEKQSWILTLEEFIRELDEHRIPTTGICFGHQIIAQALGGKVEKYSGGWGVGLHTYSLQKKADKKVITLNAMHQDQVTIKPSAASCIASSEFCNHAGLQYGDHILTFQPHPEFSMEFEKALLELRRGDIIPESTCDAALSTLTGSKIKTDGETVLAWIANFLKQKSTQ
ncbi:MAG: GMP synthase [Cellvibrionaceae bacterium]